MTDLLSIGASGVATYRTALNVVGDNIANVGSRGYVRRDTAIEQSAAGTGTNPLFRESGTAGGARVAGILRGSYEFLVSANRLTTADANRASTRAEWLKQAEIALPDDDDGLGSHLTEVFIAADALAANPGGTAPRQEFLSAIGRAATTIRSSARGLEQVSSAMGAQAGVAVASANTNLIALDRINSGLLRAEPGTARHAQLLDQRDGLVDEISGALDVEASYDARGRATLSLRNYADVKLIDPNGPGLVSFEIATDGRLALNVSLRGDPVAITPTGGTLAGLVDGAAAVASKRRQLDVIAADFATQVNNWNGQGTTPAGTPGVALMTGTDAASVDLAVTDTAEVAAATGTGAGSVANGNALAFADLRGPNGLEARMSALVTGHAQLVSAADAEAAAASARNDQTSAARDDAAGVDLDREAADLLRYQQAYQGSAKVIQVAREIIQSVLSLI